MALFFSSHEILSTASAPEKSNRGKRISISQEPGKNGKTDLPLSNAPRRPHPAPTPSEMCYFCRKAAAEGDYLCTSSKPSEGTDQAPEGTCLRRTCIKHVPSCIPCARKIDEWSCDGCVYRRIFGDGSGYKPHERATNGVLIFNQMIGRTPKSRIVNTH